MLVVVEMTFFDTFERETVALQFSRWEQQRCVAYFEPVSPNEMVMRFWFVEYYYMKLPLWRHLQFICALLLHSSSRCGGNMHTGKTWVWSWYSSADSACDFKVSPMCAGTHLSSHLKLCYYKRYCLGNEWQLGVLPSLLQCCNQGVRVLFYKCDGISISK